MNLDKNVKKILRAKWHSKRSSTKGRVDILGNPIEMRLTFEEYASLYIEAGVMPSQTYVLSRINDIGHYEIGNVKIATFLDNLMFTHNLTSELDKKINDYCLEHQYKRRTVKGMIKRGELSL